MELQLSFERQEGGSVCVEDILAGGGGANTDSMVLLKGDFNEAFEGLGEALKIWEGWGRWCFRNCHLAGQSKMKNQVEIHQVRRTQMVMLVSG